LEESAARGPAARPDGPATPGAANAFVILSE
jgi:hypothetical protein